MSLKNLLFGDHGRPIYLVGIGGIGLSGIARILHRDGAKVQGSDLRPSVVTGELMQLGVPVEFGHRSESVPEDTALLVRSAAVPDTNPEVARARTLGIPIVKYAEALGALMAGRRGIAVAGTHGKTTTTAMTTQGLVAAGCDPTMVVGGHIPQLGGTSRVGNSDVLVVEACEFDRSFLNLRPEVAVITNIEADHLDYYQDLAEIQRAFRQFGKRVKAGGAIVVCAEDPTIPELFADLAPRLITYGIQRPATIEAQDLRLCGGRPAFRVAVEGRVIGELELCVPGRYNALNALAAIGVAHAIGAPLGPVLEGLGRFTGVNRRFQLHYDQQGVAVVDDYAHHPTEIRATLQAARERFAGRRLVCVFQPHQFSRTRLLLDGFSRALTRADFVIVPDIFSSRDSAEDQRSVSARDLVDRIRARGGEAEHGERFDAIARRIVDEVLTEDAADTAGTVVVTMGAGDVFRVAERVREILLAKAEGTTAVTPGRPRPHSILPARRHAQPHSTRLRAQRA